MKKLPKPVQYKTFSEDGIVHPILIAVVAAAVLLFIGISYIAPFNSGLFANLFPKSSSSAAGNIDLELVPNNITVGVGQTFLVDVSIDAKTTKPTAAQMNIKYDPAVLEAVSFQNGYYFNTETFQGNPSLFINNTSGVAGGLLTVGPEPLGCTLQVINGLMPVDQCIFNYKTGAGSIATLLFKAKQATSTPSIIQFDTTNALTQITALDLSGDQIGTVTNSSVTVTSTPPMNKTAAFFLTPETSNQNVNNEFGIQVRASTTESANLFAAKLNFDSSKLQVTRIEEDSLLIQQWASKSFDNVNGKVTLIGGVTSPGTQTASAVIATVYFKGITVGSTPITFRADSAIYRNSDNADILNTITGSTIALSGTPAPTASPTPAPTAVPTSTPNPSVTNVPTATPIATTTPTASPEVTNCTIAEAKWVTSANPISSGKVVNLSVTGTGNCVGKTVSFEVVEDDGILGTDSVENSPPAVKVMSGNKATSSWIAEFQDDGFFGGTNPPEYYFNVTVDGVTTKSADPLLKVNKITGSGSPLVQGDANKDGKVDLIDLSTMYSNWNKENNFPDGLDHNGDGKINTLDASILLHVLLANGVID